MHTKQKTFKEYYSEAAGPDLDPKYKPHAKNRNGLHFSQPWDKKGNPRRYTQMLVEIEKLLKEKPDGITKTEVLKVLSAKGNYFTPITSQMYMAAFAEAGFLKESGRTSKNQKLYIKGYKGDKYAEYSRERLAEVLNKIGIKAKPAPTK